MNGRRHRLVKQRSASRTFHASGITTPRRGSIFGSLMCGGFIQLLAVYLGPSGLADLTPRMAKIQPSLILAGQPAR